LLSLSHLIDLGRIAAEADLELLRRREIRTVSNAKGRYAILGAASDD
jgi:hypothetical protein